MKISIHQARRIALHYQLPDGKAPFPKGKKGVLDVIEKLGYIQVDTISVVERAHHHTLWTRLPDYKSKFLDELQSKDRKIFEYWGHAASYLPISDYRFYLHRMRSLQMPYSEWGKEMLRNHGDKMQPVLDRIRTEGPLASKDFEAPKDAPKGAWWDWRPDKVALELLFWKGELMVKERKGFQRIYDLAERVLPPDIDTTLPTDMEQGRFFILRALNSYGVASEKDIHEHIQNRHKKQITTALKAMLKSGEVSVIEIESLDKKNFYILEEKREQLCGLEPLKKRNRKLYILSPFDNLVILRNRIKELFDFDYTIECYVPQAKRKYGYFSLPVLWGDRLIARMDCKAERKAKTMIVRNLVFEQWFKEFDKVQPVLSEKLGEFMKFNGCEQLVIEKTEPSEYKVRMEIPLN